MSNFAHSQFTAIPTNTNSNITDLVLHNDTLIISGKNNFFAKSFDLNTVNQISTPGPIGFTNFDFQVVDNHYYILSIEGIPYNHNLVLKSIDFGISWDTLYDTQGLFTTLTMLDTNFGIIGGVFGAYAMTQGSDTAWALDTLYSTIRASKSFGDSTMLMMAFDGVNYLTTNRGQSWNWATGTSYEHEDIQFINQDTIYAVSNKGTGNAKTFFYYSFNGGNNWSWIDIGYNSSTLSYDYYSRGFDLYFDSAKHGYIVGYNYSINEGIVFETNNYGQNWTMHPTGINEEFHSLLNINDSIAFIGGSNGLLLKWNKNIPLTTILSIDDKDNLSNIKVFPNPFSESATFKFDNNTFPLTLKIYNVFGQLVRVETINSNSYLFKRDNLKSGMYYFSINNYTGKIIITN